MNKNNFNLAARKVSAVRKEGERTQNQNQNQNLLRTRNQNVNTTEKMNMNEADKVANDVEPQLE